MMTEQEARQKWCPMARVAVEISEGGSTLSHVATCNRHDGAHPIARCIASGCMAWRWSVRDKRIPAEGYTNPDGSSVVTRYVDGPGDDPTGYCGLAGTP